MKILKEPLFHFLLIGGALFLLYGFLKSEERGETDRKVVVSAGRIEQLANIFVKTWQRPPTEVELKGLIDDFVLEEVYYRHAISMGIDKNDTMIRRRLRQKVEFITDDASALAQASDAELDAFLQTNPDKFRAEPSYTFRQLYFNPERHGDDPLATVQTMADELRGGGVVEGDRTLLPEGFEDATARAIDGTFGTGFAEQLDAVPVGEWSEPIRSGLGLHLVKVDAHTPGSLPELAEVRPVVQREWAHERKLDLRSKFNEALLEGYEIDIEWPQAKDAAPKS